MKKIKLGDIGSVRMCKRTLKEETNSEGGIPFYKISTFGNVADVFIDKDKYENYSSDLTKLSKDFEKRNYTVSSSDKREVNGKEFII